MNLRFSHRYSLRKASSGYLLVLVLVLLALLGTFIGMQVLLQVASLRAGRALDLREDHLQERHRLAQLSLEASRQAYAEAGGISVMGTFLAHGMADLPAGHWALQSQPSSRSEGAGAPYLSSNHAPLQPPSSVLRSLAGASVYPELSDTVVELPVLEFSYTGNRSQGLPAVFVCRVHPVSVPMISAGARCYELPEELGTISTQACLNQANLNDLGLCPGRDPAMVADWRQDVGTLPYHFRSKADRAETYARLFSQDQVNRLVLQLGAARTYFTSRAVPVAGPAEALVEGSDGVEANLDVLGLTQAGDVPAALLLCDDAAGRELHLSAQGATLSPLVLWVVGSAQHPRRVVLGSCARPVLLFGVNVAIVGEADAQWAGALVLSSQSSLSGGPLHVSHLACYAGSPSVDLGVCRFDRPVDSSLRAIAPRELFFAVEEPSP